MGLELLNREIFAIGTHNGDTYTEADLDEMVRAFNELDYRPALKLGHTDDPGHPAYGYIANLRRIGSKLVADFVDLTEGIYNAIRHRQYERVSAEVYWNFERAGKKFARAIKAVALLGAEVPAVAGLQPLHVFKAEAERHYDIEVQEFDAAMAAAIEDYVKKGSGPHGKQWDALGGSHTSCADRMKGKVDDPHAFCAWLEKTATGSDPSAKHTEGTKGEIMTPEELKELKDRLAVAEKALTDEKAARAEQDKAYKAMEDKLGKLVSAGGDGDLVKMLSSIQTDEAKAEAKALAVRVQTAEKQLADEKAARQAAETQLSAMAEQVEKMSDSQRRHKIEAVTSQCRLPAVRKFVAQFLDLATREKSTKVYDEQGRQVDAVAEAEAFIKFANQNSLRLFRTESTEDQTTASGDISTEVDNRTRRYMRDHKVTDYSQAMHAVLDDDPALKAAYAKPKAA